MFATVVPPVLRRLSVSSVGRGRSVLTHNTWWSSTSSRCWLSASTPRDDDGGDDAYAEPRFRSARVRLRKRYGQHLLKNADTVQRIVDCAKVQPHEVVLEIGPGTGNLTLPLLKQAAAVLAVELDPDMHATVTTRVKQEGLDHKFACKLGDFLQQPLPAGLQVCVANIPYQISSPVIGKLLAHRPALDRAIIMFQAEFADRMVARPGSKQYCRLSVNMTLLSDTKVVMFVKRTQFSPPPKIDSKVVEIRPKPDPTSLEDFEDWDAMLKLCFGGKNKTFRALFSLKSSLNALAALSDKTPDEVKAVVQGVLEHEALSQNRANGTSLDNFLRLYHSLKAAGIVFR